MFHRRCKIVHRQRSCFQSARCAQPYTKGRRQTNGRCASHLDNFTTAVEEIGAYLDTARPTAVNLHWAVTRMHDVAVLQRAAAKDGTTAAELVQGLYLECQRMLEEDIAACRAIDTIKRLTANQLTAAASLIH